MMIVSAGAAIGMSAKQKKVKYIRLGKFLLFLFVYCTHLDVRCPLGTLRFDCGLLLTTCCWLALSKKPWYFFKSFFSFSNSCSDSLSCPSTVIGLPSDEFASYTIFIFMRPSRVFVSWSTLCCSSAIFACSFLRCWFGGRSLKSSFCPSAVREFCLEIPQEISNDTSYELNIYL